MNMTQLVSMIPDWLALTAGREVSVGLSREDALQRARVLRGLLRDGKLDPMCVVLDEDLKAVFQALVSLVIESEPLAGRGPAGEALSVDQLMRPKSPEGAALADEANSAYQFLAAVEWPDDTFEEKRDLLRWLAEAGWRAVGTNLAEVDRRRLAGESPQILHDFSVDPNVVELRNLRDRSPQIAANEAVEIYQWVGSLSKPVGLFDERQYFLGEAALLAGGAIRFLGRREEADQWLCRAEAAFHLTVNPAPSLAQVLYTRLALRYDMGERENVLELLPSLGSTFEKLGMPREAGKSKLFRAMILKALGRLSEALGELEALMGDARVKGDPGFFGRVLIDAGDVHQQNGDYGEALSVYEKALPMLRSSGQTMALADLKAVVASTYRNLGRLEEAASAYQVAKADFAALGMQANTAYLGVLTAETLLALGRPREAEWEILQALPTIEEQKMVPEGFAAVALLRESVKQRKADPNALRELREHLQKQN